MKCSKRKMSDENCALNRTVECMISKQQKRTKTIKKGKKLMAVLTMHSYSNSADLLKIWPLFSSSLKPFLSSPCLATTEHKLKIRH